MQPPSLPPIPAPWERVTDTVASTAAVGGLDLCAPLSVDRYNAIVPADYRVPDFGRANALGLVLGNSRAFWDCLVVAMREDAALFASDDPIDDYVVRVVGECVAAIPFASEARFAHELPPRRVAMQKLADVASLAPLSTHSHLNVHEIYGPWIGLRALIVVDVDGPAVVNPMPLPCVDCPSTCGPALERAIGGADWRDWVAVRDACPVGREHRYSEAQIRYHYLKDREALRRFVRTGRWTKDVDAC